MEGKGAEVKGKYTRKLKIERKVEKKTREKKRRIIK